MKVNTGTATAKKPRAINAFLRLETLHILVILFVFNDNVFRVTKKPMHLIQFAKYFYGNLKSENPFCCSLIWVSKLVWSLRCPRRV